MQKPPRLLPARLLPPRLLPARLLPARAPCRTLCDGLPGGLFRVGGLEGPGLQQIQQHLARGGVEDDLAPAERSDGDDPDPPRGRLRDLEPFIARGAQLFDHGLGGSLGTGLIGAGGRRRQGQSERTSENQTDGADCSHGHPHNAGAFGWIGVRGRPDRDPLCPLPKPDDQGARGPRVSDLHLHPQMAGNGEDILVAAAAQVHHDQVILR